MTVCNELTDLVTELTELLPVNPGHPSGAQLALVAEYAEALAAAVEAAIEHLRSAGRVNTLYGRAVGLTQSAAACLREAAVEGEAL